MNVAIVILTGYAFAQIFDFTTAPALGFIFQTVILTLLLLLFGEIIPKVYAQARPLSFSRFSAGKSDACLAPLAPLLLLPYALDQPADEPYAAQAI